MKSALTLFLFPLFFTGVFGDVESVSVMEGDSVTLNTDTKIQSNEVIEWKFRGASIARINRGSSKMSVKVQTDGEFKGRLQLDNQTGDLKIMKIRVSDSGSFTLEIRRTEVSSKTFNLSVSGVGEVKSVSVTAGDSVTLNSGTNIQRDDVIQWRFADQNSPIAEHNRKTGIFSTSDGPDGIFKDRLQLDYSTGSLTIRNIGTKHSGLYEAVIRKSSGYTIHQSYSVTVRGERKPALSVKEGDSVTLHTDLTEIHTDDLMQWMFEDSVIAEIIKADNRFFTSDDVPDGRFRDRLKLDKKTGSLTITNTRTEHAGDYELKISSSRFTINKRITVIVTGERKSALVMKGESVTLHTDLTEIHTDDLMQWMFEDSVIAEINKAQNRFSISDGLEGRFRDRLKLDKKTGNLNITNTRTEDSGLYEVKIISSRFTINKRFTVSVTDPGLSAGAKAAIVLGVLLVCAVAAVGVIYYRHKISEPIQACLPQTIDIKPVSVKEGGSVTLPSGVTDIQKVEQIQWKFGECTLLAKIKRGAKKIIPSADKRFKDRLELDQTGSLTINKIKPTDAGEYMLYKMKEGIIQINLFRVSVSDLTDNRNNSEEESVTINNSEEVPLRSVETFPDSRL